MHMSAYLIYEWQVCLEGRGLDEFVALLSSLQNQNFQVDKARPKSVFFLGAQGFKYSTSSSRSSHKSNNSCA
jgi:hypothetical protein